MFSYLIAAAALLPLFTIALIAVANVLGLAITIVLDVFREIKKKMFNL